MANLSNTILDAIEIMADKKVSAAGYDRTIQATIVSQMNAAKGEYVIRYQGNKFYAYSTDLEKTYRKGATVFVLVPENDFTKVKTILGVAGNVDEYEGQYLAEEMKYEETSPDCIIDNESAPIRLCSYFGGNDEGTKKEHRLLLFKQDDYIVPDEVTDLTLSQNTSPFAEVLADDFVKTIKESGYFILRCNIQTSIPQEQWEYNQGEYGFDFIVEVEGESSLQTIRCSSNSLNGNPLKYTVATIQSWIKKNPAIIRLVAIQAYARDFVLYKSKEDNPAYDIYIKDVELYSCKPIDDAVITTRTLFLQRPNGIKFTTGETQLTVEATLKQRGQTVNLPSSEVTYFWFTEQPDVIYKDDLTQEEKDLIAIGGEGWKNIGQTNGGTPRWTFEKETFLTDELNIKCVLRHVPQDSSQAVLYPATTKFFNEDSEYLLSDFEIYEGTIDSSDAFDNVVTQEEIEKVSWTKDNDEGFTFINIDQTIGLFGKHKTDEEITTKWIALDISGDYTDKPTYTYTIDEEERNVTFVKGADVTTRNNTNVICCFYKNDNYIGYRRYNIQFSEPENNDKYYVYVLNGNRTFIYNDAGIAPTEAADGQTVVLTPVSLRLTDLETGEVISAEDIAGVTQNRSNITWLVVADEKDRLIELDDYESDTDGQPQITRLNGVDYYYAYGPTVSYHLKKTYSTNANSNEIRFIINYKKQTIIGQAQFYCYKAGDPNVALSGTYCDIIPHYNDNNNNVYTYFNIRYPNGLNICPPNWTNGAPSEGTSRVRFRYFNEGNWNPLAVMWDWLQPPQESDFIVYSGADGLPDAEAENTYVSGYGLLRGTGTIENEAVGTAGESYNSIYTAVIPIGWCSDTHIRLVENSGFTYIKYGSNGYNPVYDSNRPFEIFVLDDNGNDVTANYTYSWNIENRLYNLVTRQVEDSNLLQISDENPYPWQCQIKVNNGVNINQYDTIGIQVICDIAGVGTIKLPIHIYKMIDSDISALRGWDGHTLTLNNDPSYLLGNMVAAGVMEKNEFEGKSFTGVIIGQVASIAQDQEGSKVETGFMAFNKGKRTAFIDSKNGATILGEEDKGTINITPGRQPTISSGNYEEGDPAEDTGRGLKINFGEEPSIIYGSGKFKVDKNGKLTAYGATINGRFIAGDQELYNKIERGIETGSASYADINPTGGFAFKNISSQGEKTSTTYSLDTTDPDEYFLNEQEITGPAYHKVEISQSRFNYGDYINDTIVRGIEYRNGRLILTGNLTATGATIQGNFCAGNKQKVRELKNAVKSNDVGSINDSNKSASYVSVGSTGSFVLSSYTVEKGVEGQYLKEVTRYVDLENEQGQVVGKTTEKGHELVSVQRNSLGYTEAVIDENGFSFGTYAKNQPINDFGQYEDVQLSGIKYRKGNLTISGKITATSGMIGGWTITENCIASPGGGLKLYADGRISGYGNKESTQTQGTTADSDWLDMSGRALNWKKKSSTRKWVDQTDPNTGYKYKAFLETPNDTTVASIQSKSGTVEVTGTQGVTLSSSSKAGISLKVGAAGGLSVDNDATGTTSATVTSSSGTASVKLASINTDAVKNFNNLESGYLVTLSTYASVKQNNVKTACYFVQEKETWQKDDKGNYIYDEQHQRIKGETLHDEGYIIAVKNEETGQYIYKKHPTASEIQKYLSSTDTSFSAERIKSELEGRSSWVNNGYTFEIKPLFIPKPSRIIGYAPDTVTISTPDGKSAKKTNAVPVYDHTGNIVKTLFTGGVTHYEYLLTESYFSDLGKAIYDEEEYSEPIELEWKIYTDENKDVKLLESPDGHATLFEGLEIFDIDD